MTTDNTNLDRAIEVADHKVKERYDQKQKRRHARALIAELLRGLEDEDFDPCSSYQIGFDAALYEIKRRAGIKGVSDDTTNRRMQPYD